jgi:hypothetical protein
MMSDSKLVPFPSAIGNGPFLMRLLLEAEQRHA